MLQQCPHMHRFGFLLYWSTVIYISKKNYFQGKTWTSAIDCISYHIALKYRSNRLCVLLLWIATSPTLSARRLNSLATLNSPLWIKKAEMFWTLSRTSLKLFKVVVSFERSPSPGIFYFSISFSSSLSISMTSWEVPMASSSCCYFQLLQNIW